jgi:hypothetical protein
LVKEIKNNIMQKVSISNTFKRIAFSFAVTFLVGAIAIWISNKVVVDENTARIIGGIIGVGCGILAYMKFNTWFRNKE